MSVLAVAIAAGDIIKYQSFVYGSFVWGIHVRYNKCNYVMLIISAGLLHGDMSQMERNDVITAFKKKEMPILVATDVAGRS